MKVFTLVCADDPTMLSSTLLFLDTVRVGFPTAELEVCDNDSKFWWYRCGTTLRDKYDKLKARTDHPIVLPQRQHHADWIRGIVERTDGPYAIIDPDTIWWKNCEDIHPGGLFAGYYVPPMWNEWAGCPSVDRLHTSFLLVPDGQALRDVIAEVYPQASAYRPWDPFMPHITMNHGQPWFYDTCAEMHQALAGDPFDEDVLRRYDHLNSASFYNEMLQLVDRPEGFRKVHALARNNPSALRGLWREIDAYHERMAKKLYDSIEQEWL